MRIKFTPPIAESAPHEIRRSPEWPRVEKAHLQSQPRCVCCSEAMSPHGGVQVHHVFPFHMCIALGRPDLELDPRNLVTLCEDEAGKPAQNHHLLVGHLDDFQSTNLDVLEDAAGAYHGLTSAQIRASDRWKSAVSRRMKPLEALSEDEKQQFVLAMNRRLPKR